MKPTLPQLQAELSRLQKLFALLFPNYKVKLTIYQTSLTYLGSDASPLDRVDDDVACAESVTTILNKYMGMPIIFGTATLYEYLQKSSKWREVSLPMAGDIIISPTGYGNGSLIGHVGIVGQNQQIMSNSSATGKWSANFTISTWNARYKAKGGFPVKFYKLI